MNTVAQGLELKIPPLVVVAITALLMWLAARAMPQLIVMYSGRIIVAGVFAALGVAAAALGVIEFRKASTTVNPHAPHNSSRIVTSGIYRFTRNPMYVGMLLLLLGWAAYLANVASVVLVLVYVAYITWFQIQPEERTLAAKFGGEYEEYLRSVRRWL